jgi:hypothetical protein
VFTVLVNNEDLSIDATFSNIHLVGNNGNIGEENGENP